MATTPVGTTLHYGNADDADPATAIGQLVSVTPGGDSVQIYEVASLVDAYSTKVAGRKTPGTLSFECYFDSSASSDSNLDDFTGANEAGTLLGTTKSWKVTFADANSSTWIGNGIISAFEVMEVRDDVVRFSVTIERSGYWTLDVS